MSSSLVPRPFYDSTIDSLLGTPEIKVLVGVRRCGKSSLLELLSKRLERKGVKAGNIVHLKLDSYDVPLNPDEAWLYETLTASLASADASQTAYVLLDEVQEVEHWENVVRRVNTRPDTQVFITGSNAKVLSGELATLLSGRYVEIPVFPLSYSEYSAFAQAHRWPVTSEDEIFQRYLTYGGMPALFERPFDDRDSIQKALSAIFDSIILKDIVAREGVQDVDLLSKLIRYVFSTSGNLFSTKRVVDALTSSGRRASQETIDNYLAALKTAKILAECEQVGIAGKSVLRPKRKFYAVDNGLRNLSIGFNKTRDVGFQLEAVVFNELVRRGWQVHVGCMPGKEVDFVASRNDQKVYLQVSQSVLDEGTYQREIAPLEAISDAFPKVLLVADHWRLGTTESGIEIKSVLDWLKG